MLNQCATAHRETEYGTGLGTSRPNHASPGPVRVYTGPSPRGREPQCDLPPEVENSTSAHTEPLRRRRIILAHFGPISGCTFVFLAPFGQFGAAFLFFWPILANFGLHFIVLAPVCQFRAAFLLIWHTWANFGLHFVCFGPFWPVSGCNFIIWARFGQFRGAFFQTIILAHFGHFQGAFLFIGPSSPILGLRFDYFRPICPNSGWLFSILAHFVKCRAAFLSFWPILANFGMHFHLFFAPFVFCGRIFIIVAHFGLFWPAFLLFLAVLSNFGAGIFFCQFRAAFLLSSFFWHFCISVSFSLWPIWAIFGLCFYHFGPFLPFRGCTFFLIWPQFGQFWAAFRMFGPFWPLSGCKSFIFDLFSPISGCVLSFWPA